MQPEPLKDPSVESAPQEEPQVESAPKEKNKFKTMFFALLAVFVVTVAVLGFLSFRLNSDLKATQTDLAGLQAKHETLTAEKKKLSENLDLTKSDLKSALTDLENTRAELAKAQDDLTKVTAEKSELRARMDKAGLWMDVVIAFMVNNERDSSVEKKVEATGDAKLKDLWDTYVDTPLDLNDIEEWLAAIEEFQGYLLESIAEMLK